MHVETQHQQRPADTTTKAGAPAQFRAWWASCKRDLVMSGPQQSFVARWWADLPPTLRSFLAYEAGLNAANEATQHRWDSFSPEDHHRLLIAARTIFTELKPSSWL